MSTAAPSLTTRAARAAASPRALPWSRWDALALLALAALVLVLLAPVLAGRADLPAGDFIDQFYAFARFASAELAQGRLPTWNPYTFSGAPFLADIQSGVFYPPNLLMLLYGAARGGDLPLTALYVQVALHLFLAGAFTYGLARRRLGNRWAALLAGVTFALGGYLTSYPPLQLAVLQTDTWLPLLALATDAAVLRWGEIRDWRLKIRDSRSDISPISNPQSLLPNLLALVLVWVLVFLPGHPQSAMYVAYAALAWAVYRAWDVGLGWWRGLLLAGGTALGGLALAAAQWLPSQEYARLSVRAAASYDQLSHGFPFRDLVQVVLPGVVSLWSPLYVGLIPLGLALYAALHANRRDDSGFWAGLGLVALLLSFGGNLFVYPVFYWLAPGFNLFQSQERAAFLVSFALAMLAGAGLARLLAGRRGQPDPPSPLRPPLSMGGGGEMGKLKVLALSALVLTAVDLLRVAMPLLAGPPLPPDLGYPAALITPLGAAPAPSRVENEYRLPGNYGVLAGVEDTWGASPLRTQRYADFYAAVPADRRRRLLNVGHFVTWHTDIPGMTEVARLPVAHPITGAAETSYVLRTDPGPRAWLSYAAETTDDATALARLADPAFDPWRTTLVAPDAAAALPALAGDGPPAAPPAYHRLSPTHIAVDVDAPRAGLLNLSEVWYPGWTATVDGQPAPLLRAYTTLMAVPVAAGAHRVELRFDPPLVRLGLAISGITLLLVAIGLVWTRTRRRA